MSFIIAVQAGRGKEAKGDVFEVDDPDAMRACGKAKKEFARCLGVSRKHVRVMECKRKGA